MPTDPRYQELNLAQKLILSSAMNDDFKEKVDIALAAVEGIKNTIGNSFGLNTDSSEETYTQVNSEFEKQSMVGRATGKTRSSAPMLEALNEFYTNVGGSNTVVEAKEEDNILG